MYRLEDMEGALKEMVSPYRFRHSIGVRETAARIAVQSGISIDQAKIAGLLHDCGKQDICQDTSDQSFDCSVDDALTHAERGAQIAKLRFGVDDVEILDAIRHHTVGGAGLSTLAKIIYLADLIEPNRNFPGVDQLRAAVTLSLDQGLLLAADQTITHLIRKGKPIHTAVIEMRNEILTKVGK